MQPTRMSGRSPAISSCLWASSPMTVWCIRTWFSTEPSEYLVSSRWAASSTASEMAMPRLPGDCGSFASTARPAAVSRDGLATTLPPQVSIKSRRYGFWS